MQPGLYSHNQFRTLFKFIKISVTLTQTLNHFRVLAIEIMYQKYGILIHRKFHYTKQTIKISRKQVVHLDTVVEKKSFFRSVPCAQAQRRERRHY